MLKVTVSLIPGGVGPEQKLGELHISNVSGGSISDYTCELHASDLPAPIHAAIHRYPRWSSSVWDLVGRAIATALAGRERLPRRPTALRVPIHSDGACAYVRMSEIPEPARSAFEHRMRGAAVPVVEGESDCVYAWNWRYFIEGPRCKRS